LAEGQPREPLIDGDVTSAERLRVIHQQRNQVDHRVAAVCVPAAENRCSGAVNWIRTVPGRGWLGGFRFYSPTEEFFKTSKDLETG
jgi:hypothetical protein